MCGVYRRLWVIQLEVFGRCGTTVIFGYSASISPLFWKQILCFPFGKLMSFPHSVLLVPIGLIPLLTVSEVSISSRHDQPGAQELVQKWTHDTTWASERSWDFCWNYWGNKASFLLRLLSWWNASLELLMAILSTVYQLAWEWSQHSKGRSPAVSDQTLVSSQTWSCACSFQLDESIRFLFS